VSKKSIASKAAEAVKRRRVLKYVFKPSSTVLWAVISSDLNTEYLVLPGLYCSCKGFYMNVLLKKSADRCYHMEAVKIAQRTGVYEEVSMRDEEYYDVLMKLLKGMLKTKTRRL